MRRRVVVTGLGMSTLDDFATTAAAAQGRIVKPDPKPENGSYYRSDHFEFAKQGVPAIDLGRGVDYIGKPAEFGMNERDRYVKEDYHKPSDEVKADWDVSGAVEDLRLMFQVGLAVANAAAMPTWREGTEFKVKRDAMMAARRE